MDSKGSNNLTEVSFVLIKTAPSADHSVFQQIAAIPEISKTYALYGEYDLISKIEASNTKTLTTIILDKIRTIEGIHDTKTLIGVIANPSARPSDAGLLTAVYRAGRHNTRPAQDATFQDLQATGNLGLIRTQALRAAIRRYFANEIRAGRPSFDLLDHRFRLFAAEYVPAEWARSIARDEECLASTPAFDCEYSDDVPSAEELRIALREDENMQGLLNSRLRDLLGGAGSIQTWLDATRDLQVLIDQALSD